MTARKRSCSAAPASRPILPATLPVTAGVPVLDGVACAVSLAESLHPAGSEDIEAQETMRAAAGQSFCRRVQALRANRRGRGFVRNGAQTTQRRLRGGGNFRRPGQPGRGPSAGIPL